MDEGLPSLSSGSVGSRFVTEKDIDAANATREAEWKAAYARLGQEPPPKPVEDYDGRSLFDRLQEQKNMKQEKWEEKMKLSNQFRGIDEEDSAFLASLQDEQIEQERKRKQQESDELAAFKAAVAKREQAAPPPVDITPSISSSKTPVTTKPPATKPSAVKATSGKKDQRAILKGVIIKKRDKPKAKEHKKSETEATTGATPAETAGAATSSKKRPAEEAKVDGPSSSDTKKPRIDE